VLAAAGCGGGSAVVPGPNPGGSPQPQSSDAQKISSDVFTNSNSQHATEVEPSAFAFGSTVVAAFQSGRFFTAGASDIAFATSRDGGRTWLDGVLPETTTAVSPGNPFDSVSDPAVAYDALHGVWLIASLPVLFNNGPAPAVIVSRSSDGFAWSNPAAVAAGSMATDKSWIACDDWPTSPFYGHCYVEWDDLNRNGLIEMSTSSDGGLTWSPGRSPANAATGIGGQPLVQPDGDVVVPIDDFTESNVLSFTSSDGGASWSAASIVENIVDHFDAGDLRSGPLPSAAMDAAGTIYLVWQDCRYRASCAENDIVLSTTSDGRSWTPPVRVPIDPATSSADHFLPGIAVEPLTAGLGARIGITYYYYPKTACSVRTCQLDVGYISSADGGSTWSNPVFLAGPMNVLWLAQTDIGAMVGDYTATVFAQNQPLAIFALARPPGGAFDEAMYASKAGALTQLAGRLRSFERPLPGAHSDHAPRAPLPPLGRMAGDLQSGN
jgi:hypothetical protein